MREDKTFYVYIPASGINSTLYVGVTNNLGFRLAQHKGLVKEDKSKSFTKKYGVNQLVYYEEFGDIEESIHREKRLKKWNRAWKIALIHKNNPSWRDLSKDFIEEFLDFPIK